METTAAHQWTNKQAGIVLLVLIIGGVLAATQPVWFAPPNTSKTFWLYSCLLLLWVPVLIVLVIMHRRQALAPFFLLLIAGVVVMFIALNFQGERVSAWAIQPKDCTSHEVSPGQTEYVCTIWSIFSHQIFTLQGSTGFPFVRLVSHEFVITE
jgi:hypothetical protein